MLGGAGSRLWRRVGMFASPVCFTRAALPLPTWPAGQGHLSPPQLPLSAPRHSSLHPPPLNHMRYSCLTFHLLNVRQTQWVVSCRVVSCSTVLWLPVRVRWMCDSSSRAAWQTTDVSFHRLFKVQINTFLVFLDRSEVFKKDLWDLTPCTSDPLCTAAYLWGCETIFFF